MAQKRRPTEKERTRTIRRDFRLFQKDFPSSAKIGTKIERIGSKSGEISIEPIITYSLPIFTPKAASRVERTVRKIRS
jgi:hypothetical protein